MSTLTAWQQAHPMGPGGPSYLYVVRHFVSVVALKWYGKIMLSVWTGYFVWLALARSRRSKSKPKAEKGQVSPDREKKQAELAGGAGGREGSKGPKRRKRVDALGSLLRMLQPALRGERRWILAYVISLSVRVLITVQLADLSGRLGAYMAVKRYDSMFRGQAWFGLWCMAAAVTTSCMKYLEKRIAMSVRRGLYERLLGRYLDANLNFYRLPLGDAASRLTTDLAEFSNELTHTFGFMVKPVIDVTYLTTVLTVRLGVKSMATLYLFIVVAAKSLQRSKQLLPRSLKACAIEASQLESLLRTAHDRLHTYREQIALQRGTERERRTLSALFGRVVRNEHEMLRSKAIIDMLNSYVLKSAFSARASRRRHHAASAAPLPLPLPPS
jgi:ABC-type uncharacterized transport system fused permease/ATPase subunit